MTANGDSPDIHSYLLKAKVQPVSLRIKVAREAAIAALFDQARQFPLTFVEAPAGYGKTVFLHQWSGIVENLEGVVLWLFLDEEDTGETISDYLTFAARLSDAGLLEHTTQNERSLDQPQTFTRFSGLLAQLERSGRRIYIFLDDAERVQDASAIRLINQLIARLPRNISLVIAGRRNPGIDLASLELTGSVLRLTGTHLKFRDPDYQSFFGAEIPSDLRTMIEEKTEGWGAALEMIRIAISNAGDRPLKDILEAFSGRSDLPAQYIGNQIYSDIPRDRRLYLERLSAIEWFDQEIATVMTGSEQDVTGLIRSEPFSGFFIATSSANTSYRMHGLLREYCQQRLKEQSLEDYRKQHGVAARIMASRGHMVKALKHALEGNHEELFVEIFEASGGLKIWLREGMYRLTEAVNLFRPGMNIRYPRLGLAECIVLIKQARLHEARLLLDRITAQAGDFSGGGDGSRPPCFRYEAALDHNFVQTMMTVYGCEDLNSRVIRSLSPETCRDGEEEIVLGHNKTLLCVANGQKARFTAARKMGYEAIDHFRHAASQYGIFFIDFHLGSIDMACGRSESASRHYDKARRLAKREFYQDPGPKLIGDVLSFELAVECSRRTGLNGRLGTILNRLHSTEAWLDIYVAAYVAAGTYLNQVKAFDKLEDFLEDGLDHAGRTGISRLRQIIWLVKTDVLLAADKLEAAVEAYEMSDPGSFDPLNLNFNAFSWREIELHAWVLINLDIARGAWERAHENAVAVATFTKRAGVIRSYIKAVSLVSVIDIRQNDLSSARDHLSALYPHLDASGFYNAFVRYRRDFMRLRDETMDGAVAAGFERLLAELDVHDAANDGISFTDHETIIIEHLRVGLQDKQIARRIGLTEHAVRYHLKKIYAKVHASNRTEAIRNIDKIAS